MSKFDRISRRRKKGIPMGTPETGQYIAHYEATGVKLTDNKDACLKNVLCNCERRRCPGRTVSIAYYNTKMMEGN